MTNTFIPTLGRQPLYCVWIKTGESVSATSLRVD
jgi:hypothetical protein